MSEPTTLLGDKYALYAKDWNQMVSDTALKKTASNAFFKGHKYAPLEDILPTIQCSLAKYNFLLLEGIQLLASEKPIINSHYQEEKEGSLLVDDKEVYLYQVHQLSLIHYVSGIERNSVYFLGAVDMSPQQQGAAITYARRYHIPVVLGLCTEKDDDGNQAEALHPRGNQQVKMQHTRRGN